MKRVDLIRHIEKGGYVFMKKKPEKEIILGVAWYRPEQWDLLKSTASDPEIIEDTYKEWVAVAKKTIREMRESGLNAIKVDLDVEAFIEWCRKNGKPQDGNSRAEFVVHLLKKMKQPIRGND